MTVNPALGLPAVIAAEVAAVRVLQEVGQQPWARIPWGDLGRWLQQAPPEDALAAGLRLVALSCAYWLLATTATYVVARLVRAPAALRAVSWATVPAIRRLADRAVAVLLATTVVAPTAPAMAGVFAAAPAVPVRPSGDAPAPPIPPQPPARDPRPTRPATERETYEVVAGDHLWKIAERTVGQRHGQEAADDDHGVARYWVEVIARNRGRIRSGDPDLIYPGEHVVLPPDR